MTGEMDWNRVKDVVHAALALAPEERADFLRETCDGDHALQAEVESLLAAHAQAGSFAERPAVEVIESWSAASASPTAAEPVMRPGNRIGAYEIQAPLGAGGMGEVYRARDLTLGRDVAIKILPAAFAADPARLARFEREARVLASLNHPHIGAIYGIEEADAIRALVLELVEGQTLADRLQRGSIPIAETLTIARQIADALEAAHNSGIVHRDLKPANIAIAPTGTVKVLDFGLAKAVVGSSPNVPRSPAVTIDDTQEGLALGTAPYMSPEQARGAAVDKRTDIWAFGCVLYEMLTGCAAFPGETTADHVAAILDSEPNWATLPPATPPSIHRLLRRSLEKDLSRRLHDIGDARLEIDEALTAKTMGTERVRRATWDHGVGFVAVITAAVIAGVVGWRMKPLSSDSRTSASPLARFVMTLPPGEPLAIGSDPSVTALALSPDGRRLAYVAGSHQQIYVRPLDGFESTPIAGTEGADNPFFSPDGEWLGFVADAKLKKVLLAGGVPVTLCSLVHGGAFGASWAVDGTIVFAPSPDWRRSIGLLRVSAEGGIPSTAVALDEGDHEARWPETLPDNKGVLFSVVPRDGAWSSDATIYVQSFETGKRRALGKGVGAHYLPTGHLVYARAGSLLAVPFDLTRLSVTGDPVPILTGFQQSDDSGPQVTVSQVGSLAYIPAIPEPQRLLVWVDRTGAERAFNAPNRRYHHPKLSPDGRRLAVAIEADTIDVWMFDLSRQTLSRVTSEWNNDFPVWTPDGRRLTFSHGNLALNGQNPPNIYWKPAEVTGSEEQLLASERPNWPSSWSPDGRVLVFMDVNLGQRLSAAAFTRNKHNIWWLSREDPGKPHAFRQTKFSEGAPVFSPDGHWLAYVSNESGRPEIYVQAFPSPGQRWQISRDGGSEPVWPRGAHELFYRRGKAMMAVDVKTNPTFSAGLPRQLFTKNYIDDIDLDMWPTYDVTSDGQRFVRVKTIPDATGPTQINVVLNWFEELVRKAPTK